MISQPAHQTPATPGAPAPENEFSHEFLDLLFGLNAHTSTTGEMQEGNLCYANHSPHGWQNTLPTAKAYLKRENLRRLAQRSKRMLEIGVNAGHSALIALHANPELHYCGVDINRYRYTQLAADYLSSLFPGRVHYFPGSSFYVLPRLAVVRPDLHFDLIHIDGDHRPIACRTDFFNSIRLADDDATFIIDDLWIPPLRLCYDDFLAKGLLEPITDGIIPFEHQGIARLARRQVVQTT